MHLSCVHLTTLKILSISQTTPNFKQRTSLKVVHNSGNELQVSQKSHPYLHKLGCQHGLCGYQQLPGSLGSRSKKKEWAVMGSLVQSGLKTAICSEQCRTNLFIPSFGGVGRHLEGVQVFVHCNLSLFLADLCPVQQLGHRLVVVHNALLANCWTVVEWIVLWQNQHTHSKHHLPWLTHSCHPSPCIYLNTGRHMDKCTLADTCTNTDWQTHGKTHTGTHMDKHTLADIWTNTHLQTY